MNKNQDKTWEREGAILEGAIDKWGERLQVAVAIEEMAELIRALCKWLRGGRDDRTMANILEEMADVGIMHSQLELIFGDCTEQTVEKLQRLEGRLLE